MLTALTLLPEYADVNHDGFCNVVAIMSSSNVPKFASFRPTPVKETTTSKHDKTHDLKERRQKEGPAKPKHGQHHESSRRDLPRLPSSPDPRELGNRDSDLFMVDRKGDENNLVYGRADRWTVPAFHRFGSGCVLGVPSSIRIDRSYGEEKGLVIGNPIRRSREKYIFSRAENRKTRLLRSRKSH